VFPDGGIAAITVQAANPITKNALDRRYILLVLNNGQSVFESTSYKIHVKKDWQLETVIEIEARILALSYPE
jgi:hypothetical protein